MWRHGDSAAHEVVAHSPQQGVAERNLLRRRVCAMHAGVVHRCTARSNTLQQLHAYIAYDREDFAQTPRRHAWLILVEQCIIAGLCEAQPIRNLALKGDGPAEPGSPACEVAYAARTSPRLEVARRAPRSLLFQSAGKLGRVLILTPRMPVECAIGIGERRRQYSFLQLSNECAHARRGPPLVEYTLERGELHPPCVARA